MLTEGDSPVCLDLFRQDHVDHLVRSIGTNLRRYQSARPWADRPARVCLPTDLTPAVPLDFVMPDSDREHYDYENAVLMHQAFPNLTPYLASDPRLWTRLCHVEGWAYMRRRWDVRGYERQHPDEPGRVVGYVREHYFVAGQRPSLALTRNGMARLCWYAFLTHDENRTDQYELTRELLSQLDTAQQLLENSIGRAANVRQAFLQYLLDAVDRFGDGHARRNHIRYLARQLNRRGGLTLLDTLSTEGITDQLAAASRRYRPDTK